MQVTYPLDTLRLRMAVDPGARSIRGITRRMLQEGSYKAFFKGLGPSLLGLAFTESDRLREQIWQWHSMLLLRRVTVGIERLRDVDMCSASCHAGESFDVYRTPESLLEACFGVTVL